MTAAAPPVALPELLHLVDRAERGVALAGEYRLLRDGIRALTALSARLPASQPPQVPEPQRAPEKPSDARTAPQEGRDD